MFTFKSFSAASLCQDWRHTAHLCPLKTLHHQRGVWWPLRVCLAKLGSFQSSFLRLAICAWAHPMPQQSPLQRDPRHHWRSYNQVGWGAGGRGGAAPQRMNNSWRICTDLALPLRKPPGTSCSSALLRGSSGLRWASILTPLSASNATMCALPPSVPPVTSCLPHLSVALVETPQMVCSLKIFLPRSPCSANAADTLTLAGLLFSLLL
jgi:hypothetical protein